MPRSTKRSNRKARRFTYRRRGGALRVAKTAFLGAAAMGALPGAHGHESSALVNRNFYGHRAPVAGLNVGRHTVAGANVGPTKNNTTFVDGQGQLATWAQAQQYLNRWTGAVAQSQASPKPPKPANGNVDLCEEEADICRGHLNIPRKLMPQIYEDEIDSFREFAKTHDGISSHQGLANVSELKPSQHEISKKTTNAIVKSMKAPNYKSWPLIVSSDGYIIDGHHRWSAWLEYQPHVPIEVIVMDAPAIDVLKSAAAWHAPVTAFGVQKA